MAKVKKTKKEKTRGAAADVQIEVSNKKVKKGKGKVLHAEDRFPLKANTVQTTTIDQYTAEAMFTYGSYVVEDRAVPDLRDGLKPVHRSLLWSLAGLSLRPSSGYKKSARTVGDCFVAGTLVDTDNGKIAIEDLKVGDRVLNDRGKFEVEELFEMPPKPLMRVTVGTREVECTETQIFFVQLDDGTIVERFAKDLKPGDRVGVKRANT